LQKATDLSFKVYLIKENHRVIRLSLLALNASFYWKTWKSRNRM